MSMLKPEDLLIRYERNRSQIVNCINNGDMIDFSPPPYARGNSRNYYHFITDCLLPLSNLLTIGPPPHPVLIAELGFRRRILPQIFGNLVSIASDRDSSLYRERCTKLFGYNPRIYPLTASEVQVCRSWVFSAFKSRPGLSSGTNHRVATGLNVIVICRSVPASDNPNNPPKVRYIRNQEQFEDSLQMLLGEIGAPMTVVRSESLEFLDQVELFANASHVVAQHGAGLSNILWMRKGTSVIEIASDPQGQNHYKLLADIVGLNHHYHLLHSPTPTVNASRIFELISSSVTS